MNRDVATRRVDHQLGNHERRDPIRAAVKQRVVLSLDFVEAANSAADQNSVAERVALTEVDAGLNDGSTGGSESKLDEPVEPLDVLRGDVDVIADVVVSDFSSETDFVVRAVEPLDISNAAFARAETIPELRDVASQ